MGVEIMGQVAQHPLTRLEAFNLFFKVLKVLKVLPQVLKLCMLGVPSTFLVGVNVKPS
jgi:hypothetical protein